MGSREQHPDNTVADSRWADVVRSAGHTSAELPSIEDALARADNVRKQQDAGKRGQN